MKDRIARWQFTALIGNCSMFVKGSASREANPYMTPEIRAQLDLACREVEKLARLVKARFAK